MSQLRVVVFLIGKLGREFSRRHSQRSFISGITFAENDQSDVVRKETIQRGHQDFESLFLDHACKHSEPRSLWCRGESQLGEKRITTNLFAGESFRVIRLG